ncbi:hypothetical protein [Ruegeria atlantica]|uniref:hypothetical protein n=1 Tax=Ruegeria atlantica TaxID=81569 RepID=UPI00147DF95C|nr:hypothetical protein [Ruegeria atlantica]
MTFVDTMNFPRSPLMPGRAFDRIDGFFNRLERSVGSQYLDEETDPATAARSPLEERLRFVQDAISDVSMHLPSGFAHGLNRQFANLMDEDAWESSDELISSNALSAFLVALVLTKARKRPGIGTNGIGSVTAAWTEGPNRLTIEFLPSGKASLVLTRAFETDEPERAAFAPMRPDRLCAVLAPFEPEVWFDG